MKKLLMTSAVIMTLSPLAALAALTTDEIVAMFPGAERIEIKRGIRTTKVEVIMNGERVEMTFDNETNEVRKREVETLSEDDLRDELEDDSHDDDHEDDDDDHEDDDDDHDDDHDDDSHDDDSHDGGDDDGGDDGDDD